MFENIFFCIPIIIISQLSLKTISSMRKFKFHLNLSVIEELRYQTRFYIKKKKCDLHYSDPQFKVVGSIYIFLQFLLSCILFENVSYKLTCEFATETG